MTNSTTKAQDVFLDKINQICKKFGLNSIVAQLYAILYFSDKPLSLNDMVERLRISKGSASINIRILERYGAVKSVWVKGSRKDYYDAEKDIEKVVMERMRNMAKSRLAEANSMIAASFESLNSTPDEGLGDAELIKSFREKLTRLKEIHGRAQTMFDLFNSITIDNSRLAKKVEGVNGEASYSSADNALAQ